MGKGLLLWGLQTVPKGCNVSLFEVEMGKGD